MSTYSTDIDKLIVHGAESKLLRMLEARYPICRRVSVGKAVIVSLPLPAQHAPRNYRLFVRRIRTGLVQSNRIKRSKHADVGDYRQIVLRVAIAIRRHVNDKTDMEVSLSFRTA